LLPSGQMEDIGKHIGSTAQRSSERLTAKDAPNDVIESLT
ncbi:hypothetical protein RF55_23518, partial [Lasius niger]